MLFGYVRLAAHSPSIALHSEFIPCIYTTAVDRTLKIYDVSNYELLDTHSFPAPVLAFAVHPIHSRFILCATMEGSVALIDLVTREVVQKMRDHTKYIVRVVWSTSPPSRHPVSL
jgi:WD40 repeat protein